MVVVIIGPSAGSSIVGLLAGKVLVVGRSAGVTVLLVVVGTGAGSTGV